MTSARPIFVLILVACAGLLGYGYYLEHGVGLEPCPLCVLQRLAFFALLFICLIAALHNPGRTGVRFYATGGMLAAISGAALAGRQLWLQQLPPDQVPECGPDLAYMFDVMPLFEALGQILRGSGECAVIDWSFLGLSIAGWSLGWFILLGAGCAYVFTRAGYFHEQRNLFRK